MKIPVASHTVLEKTFAMYHRGRMQAEGMVSLERVVRIYSLPREVQARIDDRQMIAEEIGPAMQG